MGNTGIDIKEIKKIGSNLKLSAKNMADFNKALNKVLPGELLKILKRLTPKDTGETARSWKVQKSGSQGFTLINKRGGIIELLISGTKPHIIEPKDKSVLMFELGGSKIFTKIVQHPGFEPQIDTDELSNMFRKAIDRAINKILTDILTRAIKR